MASSFKSKLFLLVRISVGLFVFWWVVRNIAWTDIEDNLHHINLRWLSASIGISVVLMLLSAWKWHLLTCISPVKISYFACLRYYLIGALFNNVLPTSVGGDVVRIALLGAKMGKYDIATASIFLDRFLGLATMLVFAVLALALPGSQWGHAVQLCVLGAVCMFIILLWLMLGKTARTLLTTHARLTIVRKILRFHQALTAYRHHRKVILYAMFLSGAFYFTAAVNVWTSAHAFSCDLSLIAALEITPIILVVCMVPISVGGIGITEAAYILGMGKYGIPSDSALLIALLLRVKTVLLGALGGVCCAAGGDNVWKYTHPSDGEINMQDKTLGTFDTTGRG